MNSIVDEATFENVVDVPEYFIEFYKIAVFFCWYPSEYYENQLYAAFQIKTTFIFKIGDRSYIIEGGIIWF